jgi:hypothetical protein
MIAPTRVRSTVVMACVIALMGCSGSDTDGASSTPVDEPSTSVADMEPSTTTMTPSTTTIATTTSTAPPDPPRTTPAPNSPTEPVADALVAAREAYLYAVYNLEAPDAVDRLNATHAAGSPSLELALDNVQSLVDNGWLARPNPEVADTVTIESDVTMVDDTTAELTACIVGAGVVYAPGANADGSDRIVNGEIEAALNRVTMVLEDGQWKLSQGTNLTTESGTVCVVE